MKKVFFISLLMFSAISFSLHAQNIKKEKFEVKGNCGMCEKRIEKAAESVDGVSSADWNKETKMMEVSFDAGKTNVHKVHMAVAAAGHDAGMHKASDKAYKDLPACCQYDRSSEKKQMNHSHH